LHTIWDMQTTQLALRRHRAPGFLVLTMIDGVLQSVNYSKVYPSVTIVGPA
jgi:hypothetical protein